MNTPITKRIKQSYSKKESIAKQTTKEKGRYTKDGEVYEYDATVIPGTQAAGAKLTSGGSDEFNKAFAGARKAGKKNFEFKGKSYTTELAKQTEGTTTPGSLEIQDNPVVLEPKPGTTIDTSTAYGVRQIGRGQKKAAKDVRRATIKAEKKAGTLTPERRREIKKEEAQSELEMMKNTQKRIADMSASGVDPQITLRYEYGRGMEKGQEGGPLTDPTGKYEKEEETKARLSKKILGTSDSNVISKGYSTGRGMPKKQATPILMKRGMKMGGFGSKTYKK